MVKEVVAKYRALPPEQRGSLPALLNAIGQLELASGSFQDAKGDFAAVATMVEDTTARGQAHMNAYRAALEARDWPAALRELISAVKLDVRAFAPFMVGKYMPQRILGAGGFGVAFLCKHKYMEAQVVVKTLFDDQIERAIDQVFTEAKALSQLAHPNIVRIQDCGYTDAAHKSRPFIVMDYFAGITLEEYVQKHGVLNAEQWVEVAKQIAEGLGAAHTKGILHRDIKPANMLIKTEGKSLKVLLIDFGLAMPAQAMRSTSRQNRTLAGMSIVGTMDYAAPEQLGKLPGVAVTLASDIYGFAKSTCYALFHTTQPVLKHWQSLPPHLAELLSKCLSEQPSERPQSFDEVLKALNEKPKQKAGDLLFMDMEEAGAVSVQGSSAPSVSSLLDTMGSKSGSTKRRKTRDEEDDDRDDEEDTSRRRRVEANPSQGVPTWVFGVGAVVVVGLIIALIAMLGGSKNPTNQEIVNNTNNNPNNGPTIQIPFQPNVNPNKNPNKSNPAEFVPPDFAASGSSYRVMRDGRQYLADLEPTGVGQFPIGWTLGRGTSGEQATNTPIVVNGLRSSKGIGMHPFNRTSLTYAKYRITGARRSSVWWGSTT